MLADPEDHVADFDAGGAEPAHWPVIVSQLAGRDQVERLLAEDEDEEEDESAGGGNAAVGFFRAATNAALKEDIGRRFFEARRLCRLEQTEAAAALGYANSTQLSLIEQGKRLPPHAMMVRASEAYGVSLDFLYSLSPEPDRDPKLAARAAVVRRIERLLKFNAESVAATLFATCGSPASDELRVSRFATRANELCAAVRRFRELNSELFDDARGGATLVRACAELQDAVKQIDRFLARADHARSSAMTEARDRTVARLTAHQS